MSVSDILPPIQHPEIIVGLVGPIGVDMIGVTDALAVQLRTVGYSSDLIRVTRSLNGLKLETELLEIPIERRYQSYMDAANELRKRLERPDAFALLAIGAI